MVLVEISFPDNINPILLVLFGVSSALVVSLMMISMLSSTLMLVAILRYDCINREIRFQEFWKKRCENEFKRALKAFSYGIPLFMCVLAQIGWVVFWNHNARNYASALVTFISVCAMTYWFSQIYRKWFDFLISSDARLYNPNA